MCGGGGCGGVGGEWEVCEGVKVWGEPHEWENAPTEQSVGALCVRQRARVRAENCRVCMR